MPTSNYYVAPQDGWVEIAPASKFIRVSGFPHTHPYYLYAGASAPAIGSDTALGVLVCHHPFEVNVTTTEKLYARVVSPVPNAKRSDGTLRIDVFTVV